MSFLYVFVHMSIERVVSYMQAYAMVNTCCVNCVMSFCVNVKYNNCNNMIRANTILTCKLYVCAHVSHFLKEIGFYLLITFKIKKIRKFRKVFIEWRGMFNT